MEIKTVLIPQEGQHGMSLRDYFAAAALTGVVGNSETNRTWGVVDIAEFCYGQADAMLKAREI